MIDKEIVKHNEEWSTHIGKYLVYKKYIKNSLNYELRDELILDYHHYDFYKMLKLQTEHGTTHWIENVDFVPLFVYTPPITPIHIPDYTGSPSLKPNITNPVYYYTSSPHNTCKSNPPNTF